MILPKWITDEHAITLATWGLVLVTLLLVVLTFFLWLDSWKKGKEQRLRWKREDEHYQNDRDEERSRWEREDKLRTFQSFDAKFNSSALQLARAQLASQLITEAPASSTGILRDPKPQFRLSNWVPSQAWRMLDFFAQVARNWKNGELELGLINVTFGDYVLTLCSEFRAQLASETFAARYCELISLHEALKILRDDDATRSDLFEAEWSQGRARFWNSEFQLYRLFGDLPALPHNNDSDFPR